jgi:hypothetical protein
VLTFAACSGCGRNQNPLSPPPGGNAAGGGAALGAGGASGGVPAANRNDARYRDTVNKALPHVREIEAAYVTLRQVGDYEQVRSRFNSARSALDQLAEGLSAPTADQRKALEEAKVVEPLADAIHKAQQAERRTMRDFMVIGFWNDPLDGAVAIARRLGFTRSFGPAGQVTPANPSDPPAANTTFADLSVFGPDGGLLPKLDPESPASVPWRLVVDAPTVPYEVPPEMKLGIDVPGFPQRADQFQKVWESRHTRLVYPLTSSVVVAAGLNEKTNEAREVWSLSPRKRIGRIRQLQLGDSKIMAISSDGLYFAAQPAGNDLIGLYDVVKDKPIGTVLLDKDTKVRFLGFAAGNRLVACFGETVRIWSVPSLEQERDITLKSALERSPFVSGHSWSLSPGGRYLAAPHRRSSAGDVYFYELTTGEMAGGLEVMEGADFIASAFSDDGTRLAVLATSPWKGHLQTWDIAAGTIIDEWVFEQRLDRELEPEREYQGPALEWFPDGRRLFVHGRGIFDTAEGDMARTLPDTAHYRIKPLAGDSVAVIIQKQLVAYDTSKAPESAVSASVEGGGFGAANKVGPSQQRPQKTTRGAPRDTASAGPNVHQEIEDAWAKSGIPRSDRPKFAGQAGASQGGFGAARSVEGDASQSAAPQPQRPGLPELTAVDRSTTTLAELTPPVVWSARLPVYTPASSAGRAVELPRNELFAAAIAQDASRALVMYSSERPSTWEHVLSKIRIHFIPVDLATGTKHPSIELPLASGLLDIAPHGERFVSRSLSQPDRVDVWALPGGEPVASFRPYPQGTFRGGQAVEWAGFIAADHVLTLGGGRISLWKLPECRAVYELATTGRSTVVLSASRTLAALISDDGGRVLFVNTRDGAPAGGLALDAAFGKVSSITFHPRDTHAVLATQSAFSGELALVDLATGAITRQFPVPARPTHVQWCGDERLLLNGAYLMDIASGALAWVYDVGGHGRHLVDSPDGRHWYLAPKVNDHETLVLAATDLPDPAALGKLGQAAPPQMALEPGSRIALDLQMPAPPGRGQFADEVRAALTQSFQSADIQVDDAAPLKLSIRGTSEKTGELLTTSLFGFGIGRRSGDIEIDEQRVTWTIAISQGPQTLWQTELSATNAVSVTIDGDASAAAQQQSVEQQTIQKMWENAASRLLDFEPPRHLFSPEAARGLGRSSLTPQGAVAALGV